MRKVNEIVEELRSELIKHVHSELKKDKKVYKELL